MASSRSGHSGCPAPISWARQSAWVIQAQGLMAGRGMPRGRARRRYHPTMESASSTPRGRWALAALLALVLAGVLGVAWYFLPLREGLVAMQARLAELGAWGVVLFEVVFVLCVVAMVPG